MASADATIDAHLEAYRHILSEFSDAEQHAMFAGNALRIYRMKIEV